MIVQIISKNGILTSSMPNFIGSKFVVLEEDEDSYRLSNHFWVNKEDCKLINNQTNMEMTELVEKVKEWAQERGLYEKGDPITQLAKLTEENGELARGLLKEDMDLIVDSIGDSLVVLVNLTELVNRKYPEYCGGELTLEFCLSEAYGEIKDRKGSMKNGTFTKE